MNTEGRLTRSRARTTGTPLVKPFGTEIRPRNSRLGKDLGTPLPRVALFDRTNDASEDKEESADNPVTVEDDPIGATISGGAVVNDDVKLDAIAADIPHEDNIVKQLLEEYTTIEENMEAEMHITPMRTQPVSAVSKELIAAKAEDAVPKPVEVAAAVKKVQQSIHEEMLITPQRIETAPAQCVVATENAVPEAEPKPATPHVPTPVAEVEVNATAATETVTDKEGDGDEAMLTTEKDDERWQMDGSPYISETVPVAAEPVAKASKHAVKSAIKPTTPFDPRSLRQIKQELKAAAAKPKVLPGLSSDSKASNTTMYTGAVCVADAEESEEASSALCKALDDLLIAPKVESKEPLRGIPVAAGRHMHFTEEGEAVESPSAGRTLLRGFPAPAGSHLRFED